MSNNGQDFFTKNTFIIGNVSPPRTLVLYNYIKSYFLPENVAYFTTLRFWVFFFSLLPGFTCVVLSHITLWKILERQPWLQMFDPC